MYAHNNESNGGMNMLTRNRSRRGRTLMPLFGSLALLATAAALQSCADNVGPGGSSTDYRPYLREGQGAFNLAFDNLDDADIYCFAQSDLRYIHDDREGDDKEIHYSAVAADALGVRTFTHAKADGATLELNGNGVLYNGYSQNGTTPGGTSTWDLTTDDGVTLTGGQINVPQRPEITSPLCYQQVSISGGLNVSVNSSVTGGDAVVVIAYDSYRDGLHGLAPGAVTDGANVASRTFIRDDDGTLELSATDLAGLDPNRVYLLSVFRWQYGLATRSDGTIAGLVADVGYAVPVILTP